MKIFCSYAYTGEDEIVLENRLRLMVDELERLGHDVYCFHFSGSQRPGIQPKEAILEALSRLQDYDALFVMLASERRSEGLLIEVGAAISQGKKLFIAQHASAVGKTYLPDLAEYSYVWSNEAELTQGITDYFSDKT